MSTQTPERKRLVRGPFPGTLEKAWVTQHCLAGRHEGMPLPENWPHCKMPSCQCACHTIMRGLQPGDAWVPDFEEGMTPAVAELAQMLQEIRADSAKRKVETADIEPDAVTDTGRRRKGALELQVLDVCRRYTTQSLKIDDGVLSPRVISEEIAELYNCGMPSSGAIQAVLERWEGMQFCYLGRKPLRFVTFSGEPTEEALQLAKDRHRG